jgi:DNA-binding HxlR family transcriptional regulator
MEPPVQIKPTCLQSSAKNLIALLGKSYVLEMLYFMNNHQKPVRFNELKRELSITATTLSRRLDEFSRSDLLVRKVYAEVPARVEYSLSEKGKSLGPALRSLFKCVNSHYA